MSKKTQNDSMKTSNFVVNGAQEDGVVLELPHNVAKIRLETDNKNLFYRAYGTFDDPDTQLVLSAPGCQMIIIKDGVSSGPLNNGAYPVYDDKDIIVKKSFFNRKGTKKVKEGIMFDIIVFNSNLSYEAFWGTPSPIPYRDPETDIPVEIKGRGKYDIRISNVEKFFNTLVGSNRNFKMDDLLDRINTHVIQILRAELSKVIHDHHLGYIDLALHESEVAEAIQPIVSLTLNEQYGLYVPIFSVSEFFIDDAKKAEIEAALKNVRDEKKYKADAKEIAAELERLDDKEWERTKFLIGLRREDEAKYLDVIKILGYPNNPAYAANKEKAEEKAGKRFCAHCGAELERGEPFCPKCGEPVGPVERKCPHCGKVINSKGKFCPHCGKEI